MLPAMCQKPPWMNIEVTVVINGASASRPRGAGVARHAMVLVESARETEIGTSAYLAAKAWMRGPSMTSWMKTATLAKMRARLTGVARRGVVAKRNHRRIGPARAVIGASYSTGASRVGASGLPLRPGKKLYRVCAKRGAFIYVGACQRCGEV